jgi:cysteine synthase A
MVAAVKGYKLILVMPDSMSHRAPPPDAGLWRQLRPDAARERHEGRHRPRRGTGRPDPGAWIPQQFENPANIDVHVRTTAQEILADFPDGLDVLITGVGTGGHLTGTARC